MTNPSKSSGGDHRPFIDFSSLLDALTSLYMRIGGRLLHGRMSSGENTGQVRETDIEAKLERRLHDVSARAMEEQDRSSAASSGEPADIQPSTSEPAPNKRGKLGRLGKRLVSGLSRRPTVQSQLHLSEKMQASTWEHINKAQLLARQGKMESARMHAGLAESAMRTAARYMGEDEYSAFEKDVEARIRAIGVK